MRLYQFGLLVGLGFLLCLAEFLDQTHGLALETTVESTSGAGVDHIAELFRGKVEESDAESLVGDGSRGQLGRRTGQGRCHGRKICGTFSSS